METGLWTHAKRLPYVPAPNRLTLGEGQTPLLKSRKLANRLGIQELYFKMESSNPTGSYKDRIAALGLSYALSTDKKGCIGTSSGNAGASVAAYAALAGIPYHLLVLERIVDAKLIQASMYGAEIVKIEQFGESTDVGNKVFEYIVQKSKEANFELMITAFAFNRIAMEAVKTIAFEIYDQMNGSLPDAVFVPVGGGGLCLGTLDGIRELETGTNERCSVVAVQSEGCSNLYRAWKSGAYIPAPGDSTSNISGLQVPNPPDGEAVLKHFHNGAGWAESIVDEETWMWQEWLAREEAILCEPAAAISVAGLVKAVEEGRVRNTDRVVCVITGAGYKDGARLNQIYANQTDIPLKKINEL